MSWIIETDDGGKLSLETNQLLFLIGGVCAVLGFILCSQKNYFGLGVFFLLLWSIVYSIVILFGWGEGDCG